MQQVSLTSGEGPFPVVMAGGGGGSWAYVSRISQKRNVNSQNTYTILQVYLRKCGLIVEINFHKKDFWAHSRNLDITRKTL